MIEECHSINEPQMTFYSIDLLIILGVLLHLQSINLIDQLLFLVNESFYKSWFVGMEILHEFAVKGFIDDKAP